MASEFPDANGASTSAATQLKDNIQASLEKGYARLNEVLFRCDGLIPQEGLKIWGGDDLKGKRTAREKKFKSIVATIHIKETLGTTIPDTVQQEQVVGAAADFLETVANNYDESDNDTIPLGQLDKFLEGFPDNMIGKLGVNCTPDTIVEIFRLGQRAIDHHEVELQKAKMKLFPNYPLGEAALLVGEVIPAIAVKAGENQKRILAEIGQAAVTIHSYDFKKAVEKYGGLVDASHQFSSPEEIQNQILQMEQSLREIDPNLAERQFNIQQIQDLLTAVNVVAKAVPDTNPNEVLAVLIDNVTDRLQSVCGVDQMAGHFLIGQGIRVITRGLRTTAERNQLATVNIQDTVNRYTQVAAEVIQQLNAGRTGRGKDDSEDWESIGSALGRNLVQRIIDLESTSGRLLPAHEIISWLNGSHTPIRDETWRIDGVLATTEAIGTIARGRQADPSETAKVVTELAQKLNALPVVIHNHGYDIAIRNQLAGSQLNLSIQEIAAALEFVQSRYAELSKNEGTIDYHPARKENIADQFERGVGYAMGVQNIREYILQTFLKDSQRATQMVRACALVSDIYSENIFQSYDKLPFDKFQELISTFSDAARVDFFSDLARLMEIYDQQNNMGQRELVKDSLALVLNTDNPGETLSRILEGGISSIKAVAWLGRLAGESKISLSAIDAQPAIAMLIGKTTERQPSASDSQAIALRGEGNALMVQITESSAPLAKAMHAYAISLGGNEQAVQALRAKIGSLRLQTAEDAQAFLPAIMPALAKFFHVPEAQLREHMVSVQPVGKIIEQVPMDTVAGQILRLSAAFGGGEVPHLAFNPRLNSILVNEEFPRGYTIDELGEEIGHWIRETLRPNQENYDTAVHEFFGFLGKRIVRAALGLEDITRTPEDFAEDIRECQTSVLDRERFSGMIDTGFEHRLHSAYAHMIGYVAASNIPLEQITEELIRLGEIEVRERYLRKYGPNETWLLAEEKRIREFYATEATGGTFGEPLVNTKVEDLLNPLFEAWYGEGGADVTRVKQVG